MSYTVLITRPAQSQLAGFDAGMRERIYAAMRSLGGNPRPPGCPKLKERVGWRIRVGSIRIIYEIDDATQRVLIRRIGHRKEIYR